MSNEILLDEIGSEVSQCRLCPRLVEWREEVAKSKRASYKDWDYWGRGVPCFGDPNAKVMVVGLAPAAHGANRTGRMFTGDRSGDWLFGSLHRTGFSNQPNSFSVEDGLVLSGVVISAPVKCAPPQNKPTIEERDNCIGFLEREIAVVKPKVFVALGKFAFDILSRRFEVKPRVAFAHGAEVRVNHDGRPATLLGCYHVSQQNTFTGKLTEPMLDAVFHRAKSICG